MLCPQLIRVAARPLAVHTVLRRAPLSARPAVARLFSVSSLKRDDDDEERPALSKRIASTLGAASVLSLPALTTKVLADGAVAAPFVPMVSGASLWFLQMFPPVAAQAVFLAPMGAMAQIKKDGDVGDMPLLPYAAMAVNGVGWVAYGLLQGQPTIWVPNITAFGFGVYYWYTYSQYMKASNVPWLAGGAGCVVAIGALASATEPIMGYDPKFILGLYLNAVVVAMFGGPLMAIKGVIDTKDTSSIPILFSVATFVNCTVWTAFGVLVVNDPMVWFCNTLGLGSAIAQLSCHAMYGIDGAGATAPEPPAAAEAAEEKVDLKEEKDEEPEKKQK